MLGAFDSLGFPAHAGMDPWTSKWKCSHARFPRPRGDGPEFTGTTRVIAEVSPPTRGWTRRHPDGGAVRQGFPAHAGMDPSSATSSAGERIRFPRPRGDGPIAMAREPVGCDGRFPRPRGDGPSRARRLCAEVLRVSPPTRGWTLPRSGSDRMPGGGFPAHAGMDPPADDGHAPCGGFPAHAGMDHPVADALPAAPGFPRPRGDGPVRSHVGPHDRARGFPAHAGMDPVSWNP